MGVCRTSEVVSVVSDSEVFVMCVTLDGENPAWISFRKSWNTGNSEGSKILIKEVKYGLPYIWKQHSEKCLYHCTTIYWHEC